MNFDRFGVDFWLSLNDFRLIRVVEFWSNFDWILSDFWLTVDGFRLISDWIILIELWLNIDWILIEFDWKWLNMIEQWLNLDWILIEFWCHCFLQNSANIKVIQSLTDNSKLMLLFVLIEFDLFLLLTTAICCFIFAFYCLVWLCAKPVLYS